VEVGPEYNNINILNELEKETRFGYTTLTLSKQLHFASRNALQVQEKQWPSCKSAEPSYHEEAKFFFWQAQVQVSFFGVFEGQNPYERRGICHAWLRNQKIDGSVIKLSENYGNREVIDKTLKVFYSGDSNTLSILSIRGDNIEVKTLVIRSQLGFTIAFMAGE
jgi:hypothetical protein